MTTSPPPPTGAVPKLRGKTGSALHDEWLSLEGIAEELDVPKRSVYAWRSQGIGPKGYKIGKHVRVKRSDFLAWLEQRADEPRQGAA